jgi:hypothetical protein
MEYHFLYGDHHMESDNFLAPIMLFDYELFPCGKEMSSGSTVTLLHALLPMMFWIL